MSKVEITSNSAKANILKTLHHGVVVSVQASRGEPLNRPDILSAMAEAVLAGGACGIRMAQLENLIYFRHRHPNTPLIGITKPDKLPPNAHEQVYITPTLEEALELAHWCDIIAMDATLRPRPKGDTLEVMVEVLKKQSPKCLLMADISNLEEGLHAEQLGFDLIGTTLSGYTSTSKQGGEGPDFALLAKLKHNTDTPIVLEGRIWEPSEVSQAYALGAHTVVIGSAISRPHEITRRFVQAANA